MNLEWQYVEIRYCIKNKTSPIDKFVSYMSHLLK